MMRLADGPGIALAVACGLAFVVPSEALVGTRAGDCWTDNDGTNYCGDSGSSASDSSSSYGWTYTYGYTDTQASSGPSWAERVQEAREARQLRAEYEAQQAVRREALRLNDLGIKASSQGNFEQAAAYYLQAHNTDPSDAVILNNLNSARGSQSNEEGNRYYEANAFEQAVAAYQKAYDLKPDSEVIRDNLEDAKRQLEYQREALARQRDAQDALRAAKGGMESKLSELTAQLSAGPAPEAGLSFQTLPAQATPGAASQNAFDQLKSVWFHGQEAKRARSDEEAATKAQLGFDTAGVAGSGVDATGALEIPVIGESEAGTPVQPAKGLQFKGLTESKAVATAIPEFDPTLPIGPNRATIEPKFDPELARLLTLDSRVKEGPIEESPPEPKERFVPLTEENWEIIKKDPEVRDALTARDAYYMEHQRQIDLASEVFKQTHEGIKADLRKKNEFKNATEAELTAEVLKNPRFQTAVSDLHRLVVHERTAWRDYEQTISSAIEKKRDKMWRESQKKEKK